MKLHTHFHLMTTFIEVTPPPPDGGENDEGGSSEDPGSTGSGNGSGGN